MQTAFILAITGAVAMWLVFRLYLLLLFRPYRPVRLLGRTWQGILPAAQPALSQSIAAAIHKAISEGDLVKNKLASPELLQGILPEVEKHIDHFLQVKLKSALPVIGMFIGDKVTGQLKTLFMQELETLFPSVMSQIFDGLQHNTQLQAEISVKLQLVQPEDLEISFFSHAKKAVNRSAFYFTAAGFIIGFLQGLLVYVLER